MTLYKRGRVWWYEFRLDGQKYRASTGVTVKTEARNIEADARAAIRSGRQLSSRMRLVSWAPHYIERVKADGKKSWDRDEQAIKHLKRHLGSMQLAKIDADAVREYQRKRLREKNPRTGKNPSNRTVNIETQCLHHMLEIARARNLIGANPIQGYKRLDEATRGRVVTPDELTKILAKAPDWLRVVLALAFETGMRRSEVVRLRWDQVDFERRMIYLEATDTKTAKSRAVPLSDAALAAIRSWPRRMDGGRLFEDKTPNAATMAFRRAAAEAGVEGVRLHDLRHTRVTVWYEAGHPERLIMAASGHKTQAVFGRYVHLAERGLRGLVDSPQRSTQDDGESTKSTVNGKENT